MLEARGPEKGTGRDTCIVVVATPVDLLEKRC